MSLFRSTLVFIAGLAPLAHAVGWANVYNNCPYPIYLWSISNPPFYAGPMHNITTGECYSEEYNQSISHGGVSLSICTTGDPDCLWNKSPQTDFGYTLEGETVWYDLTDQYGHPFEGCPLSVEASNPECEKESWEDGVVSGPNEMLECR